MTHGTDTMAVTAARLASIPGKTIVLTGALAPARFSESDASFNLGMAFATTQVAPAGVYIVMNGEVFPAGAVRKDRGGGTLRARRIKRAGGTGDHQPAPAQSAITNYYSPYLARSMRPPASQRNHRWRCDSCRQAPTRRARRSSGPACKLLLRQTKGDRVHVSAYSAAVRYRNSHAGSAGHQLGCAARVHSQRCGARNRCLHAVGATVARRPARGGKRKGQRRSTLCSHRRNPPGQRSATRTRLAGR